MTAIILAAGRGLRMGPRGRLRPKGLLTLGGRTLIDHSVAALKARGVRHIRIVTGHLSDQYESLFYGNALGVELRFNPQASEMGSLHSLRLGLEGLTGPCVILESDLIYQPQALSGLVEIQSRLITSSLTGAGDEVYVWSDPSPGAVQRLRTLSKDRAAQTDAPLGELVGITGITAQAMARLRKIAADLCSEHPFADYEEGIVALSAVDPVHCHLMRDLIWAEIDDEAMYERAKGETYPQVAMIAEPVR